jgi:hypothetical protein
MYVLNYVESKSELDKIQLIEGDIACVNSVVPGT